jgi:hypothetical protein
MVWPCSARWRRRDDDQREHAGCHNKTPYPHHDSLSVVAPVLLRDHPSAQALGAALGGPCHDEGLSYLGAIMNVCGHPYSLQIRSRVSKSGERVPASNSRYSRGLTPIRQATWPMVNPCRSRSFLRRSGNAATSESLAADNGVPDGPEEAQ